MLYLMIFQPCLAMSEPGLLNRRLYYSGGKEITEAMVEEMYHCPVDLIAHGIPHRVLPSHEGVVGH